MRPYLELPHDGYFHEAFFARMKADAYFMLGDYTPSLANYELALQASPDDGLLNFYAALCLAVLDRIPDARREAAFGQHRRPTPGCAG